MASSEYREVVFLPIDSTDYTDFESGLFLWSELQHHDHIFMWANQPNYDAIKHFIFESLKQPELSFMNVIPY